jgi:hypothetical protein
MGLSETTNYNALVKNSVHTFGTIFGSVTFERPTQHHDLAGTHAKYHTGMAVGNVLSHRFSVRSNTEFINTYCGIFAESKTCEARKTAVASERL